MCENRTVLRQELTSKMRSILRASSCCPWYELGLLTKQLTFQIGRKHFCFKKKNQSIFKLLKSCLDTPAVGLFHSVHVN